MSKGNDLITNKQKVMMEIDEMFGRTKSTNEKFEKMCLDASMTQIKELETILKTALKFGLFEGMSQEEGMRYIDKLYSNLLLCIVKMRHTQEN